MADTDPAEFILYDTDLVTKLGIIPFNRANFHTQLSETGSGNVNFSLDSTLASQVESGQYVSFSYRGAIRGGFFVDNISRGLATPQENEGREIAISGRGALALLDDAIVWDDGSGATTRTFTGTQAAILIQLIQEAQNRGGLQNVTVDFTASDDSASIGWTDSAGAELTVGTTLLDVVRKINKLGYDFEMLPDGAGNFVLSAYSAGIGTNKASTLYFRTGVNCEDVGGTEVGLKVKNALNIKYKNGFTVVTDPTSISARRRREKSVTIDNAGTVSAATTWGGAEVALSKDPTYEVSVKLYDGASPSVFVDYILGDTVTLDVLGNENAYRARGINFTFDGDNFASIVIDFNSLTLENEIQLTQDVERLNNLWKSAHDAELLEVTYWAAIGDPNEDYIRRDSLIVGDTFYIIDSTVLRWYNLQTGGWSSYDLGAAEFPRCMTALGTDIYIGGNLKVFKFDTTTEAVTTLTSFGSGSVLWIATVGTGVYFAGSFDTLGTVLTPNGVIEYKSGVWTDIGGGVGTSPNFLRSDGSYLYIPVSGEVHQWDGVSWTQLGTFPVSANDITSDPVIYGTSVLFGTSSGAYLYEWDGAAWNVFATISGGVISIAVYLTDVYLSGNFTAEGNYITKYSGGGFYALAGGLDAPAYILPYEGVDGVDIVATGAFTTADGKPANEVAIYYNNFEALSDYLEHSNSTFNLGEAIHNATAKTPMVGADEMPLWDSITQRLRKITWTNILASIKTYTDGLYVALTGNQTIAGIKTFLSFPVTPSSAPSTDYEVANKKYVDDNAGGGTPGGSDTQVQFNDGGSFGGSAEFTYDDAGKALYLGNTTNPTAVPRFLFTFASLGRAGASLYTFGTAISSYVRGVLARGTDTSPTAVQSGDVFMEYRGAGYDGTTAVGSSPTEGKVAIVASENHDSTHHGTDVEIHATPAASTTLTKILSILGSGHLNIATGKEYQVNGAQHTHAAGDVTSGTMATARLGSGTASAKTFLRGDQTYVKPRFFLPFGVYTDQNPLAVSGYPFATTINNSWDFVKWSQFLVVLTTNDGSNYWTVELRRISDLSLIASFNTSAISPNVNTTFSVTSFSIASTTSTDLGIFIQCTRVGAAGGLYMFNPEIEVVET